MSLFALILIPLAFAVYAALRPAKQARLIALLGTLVALGFTVWAMVQFDWGQASAVQFEEAVPWLAELGGSTSHVSVEMPVGDTDATRMVEVTNVAGGVALKVGVDSVSMMLIALTALLGPICVLASFTAITERTKTYYVWLLVLQAAMTGVFASRDIILFYICFEFTLIPMWILIHLYGSTNRKRAATKFFLYTFTGSLIALAGLVYVAWANYSRTSQHLWSFDITELQRTGQLMTTREQGWVLLALLAGFAVKVPLFPLHTWLPLAHTEAPTAGSVILAGVLLKLGTYGIYRFALPMCPAACWTYAPAVAVLSIIGIVYAGLICWVQTDVKKLVAYSSVAHLGFCILGMFAFNVAGLTGSVLYMINHGLSTGALFLMIGMIYERYHTRSMKELNGLAAKMPVWATFMVFFTMASVGLPGLNGFISEFLCIFGTFQAGTFEAPNPGQTGGPLGPWYGFIAGTGMIVAAMYLLLMLGKVVWGMLVEPHGESHGHGHGAAAAPAGPLPRDLSWREITTLLPLAVACLALGVYPKPLLKALEAPTLTEASTVIEGHARAEGPAAPGAPIAQSTGGGR